MSCSSCNNGCNDCGYASDYDQWGRRICSPCNSGGQVPFQVAYITPPGSCPQTCPVPTPTGESAGGSLKVLDTATDVPMQVVYVPQEDGLYYMSVGGCTKTAGSGTVTLTVTWTNNDGPQTITATVDLSDLTSVTSDSDAAAVCQGLAPILVTSSGGPYSSGTFDAYFSAKRQA